MWKYKNGNYIVKILDDGTKLRLSDNPIPVYPESIDVKITNKCNVGCPFCHEKSTPDGKKFDVDFAYNLFKDLSTGIELAIGGGNPLESKQDLQWLMRKLGDNRLIFNITINALHLDDIENLYPVAIGISYHRELHDKIKKFIEDKRHTQCVIHLIAGVHTLYDLDKCWKDFDRILVLGYKQVGRGKDYFNDEIENNLKQWSQKIGEYIYKDKIMVFDNLSIKQLDMKRFFNEEKWDKIYMGDDGQFTMYLDLVEKKYAVSSRSEEKFDIGDLTIKEMFADIKKVSSE